MAEGYLITTHWAPMRKQYDRLMSALAVMVNEVRAFYRSVVLIVCAAPLPITLPTCRRRRRKHAKKSGRRNGKHCPSNVAAT